MSNAPQTTPPLPQPTAATQGQRVMIILIAVVAVGLALLITVAVLLQRGQPPAGAVYNSSGESPETIKGQNLPILGTVADFTLTDQNDLNVAWTHWKNQIVIVDFIFTRCQGPCPRMTARMAQLQKSWKDTAPWKDLKLVSISVDPDNDTPQVLRDYAKMVDANLAIWTFLRGSREQIIETATKSFRVPVEIAPVGSNEPIMHTQKFVLVDRSGNIRGYYNGLDPEAYAKLQSDLQQLIAQPATQTTPAPKP